MTLVQRLRRPVVTHHQVSDDWEPYATVAQERPVEAIKLEAADELERLQAEVERLRGVAEECAKIADAGGAPTGPGFGEWETDVGAAIRERFKATAPAA